MGLDDGVVAEVFPVGDMDSLAAQLHEDVIHQLIHRSRDTHGRNLLLHFTEFFQGDGGPGERGLLVLGLLLSQHRQPYITVIYVLDIEFQFQPVVEGPEDGLSGVIEVRDLIGRREEGDGGNVHRHPLVGVPPLVEGGEQGD